jgi:oligoribonuclease
MAASDITELSRSMKREGLIVWIDMEMSGLDPDRDRILEMATIVTDGQLVVVAEGPEFVIHQPASVLDAMDEWNQKHHAASGLLDRVRRSTVREAQAEEETLRFLMPFMEARTAPLAGNSIHQDRRFIARHMGRLDHFLHYRMIDVSSIKELAKRWYPHEYKRIPGKKNTHRALDDIRESIDELRWWRRNVFR